MDEESNKRLGELIKQLANGNSFVLEEIALLLERILKTIANIYYKNQEDVEDEIQTLYVTLYEKAKHFKTNTNACAWVIKIFENSIKNRLRKHRNEDKFLREEVSNFKSSLYACDDSYVENHLFLREVFDKLTEEERNLVIYYHWCKCTVREVAQILQKPKSTVNKKLHKLEEKIKNI